MDILRFDDERIESVLVNGDGLTTEEREFLVGYTSPFEECSEAAEELAAMSDKDLMRRCYEIWCDYASGQV